MKWILGSELSQELQKQCISCFSNRFTGEHMPPRIAKLVNAKKYPQFKDDKDWLANTKFAITNKNKLSLREKYCASRPTWPNGCMSTDESIEDIQAYSK